MVSFGGLSHAAFCGDNGVTAIVCPSRQQVMDHLCAGHGLPRVAQVVRPFSQSIRGLVAVQVAPRARPGPFVGL